MFVFPSLSVDRKRQRDSDDESDAVSNNSVQSEESGAAAAVVPASPPPVEPVEPVLPDLEQRMAVGRPRLKDPIMSQPTCDGAPTTVGSYIHDLLTIVSQTGMTHNAAELMFDTIRKHTNLPHQLPNYRHSLRLLSQSSSVESLLFACCPNDCFMQSIEEFKKRPDMTCIHCKASLSDGKGRAKKVSYKMLHSVTECYCL